MPASTRFSLIESDTDSHLASFAEEVERGLTGASKSLPCRFLYDEAGSQLFEDICDLPEYYVTRAERQILERHADAIAEQFPGPITLAELGSGSSAKTRLLIEAFLEQHGALRYVPVDISRSMLEESALSLLERYEGLEIRAIASEYHDGLSHVRRETDRAKLIAWLGSNVGNFDRAAASRFLAVAARDLAGEDSLLVGIDLRKDRAVLERAYDDARGVTARFNLNLLARINRELGGGFDLASFRHRATYREKEGFVELELVSLREQRVRVEALELEIDFAEGEPIHTESSYKYSLGEIDRLAASAGLHTHQRWLDSEERFSVNLMRPSA